MRLLSMYSMAAFAGLGLSTAVLAADMSDDELIENAMSAAPDAVASAATIIAIDENGEVRTLREGTNNFTCLPDDPGPGNNPMCLDQNAMAWAEAWMNKTEPPKGKVGFGYMLAGGATPSNVDPFAEAPEGAELEQEPPHVMLFALPELPADYPQPGDTPDRSQPWVMWAGTPYEHLMIPVE
ncbi:hypothetical protein [Chelativorans alearense]|uniref:hypothetical protein n=1 Tax=Chelativorans alearense TaxID=2681495 RepID=UPI001FE3E15F|nr:hypothetical protein [Chelativorans alearense]